VSDQGGGAGYIDQFTIGGGPPSVVQVPLTSGCGGYALALGTDGNPWFSDSCSNVGMVPIANFSPGGMLMWSVIAITGDYSIQSLVSSPSGVWGAAYNSSDNHLYQIGTPAGLSASQGPPITPVPAFGSASGNELVVTALGPDGNIWTGTDNLTPSVIAKVIYGAPGAGALSTKRASAAISRVRQGAARGKLGQRMRGR